MSVAVYPALGVWMVIDGAYAAKGEPTDGGVRFSIDEAVDAVRSIGDLSRPRVRQAFEQRFTARRMAEHYVEVYQSLIDG